MCKISGKIEKPSPTGEGFLYAVNKDSSRQIFNVPPVK